MEHRKTEPKENDNGSSSSAGMKISIPIDIILVGLAMVVGFILLSLKVSGYLPCVIENPMQISGIQCTVPNQENAFAVSDFFEQLFLNRQ